MTYRSEFLSRIGVLLAADIALAFAYGIVPPVISPIRTLLALVQLGFLVLTMIVAISYVLEDY